MLWPVVTWMVTASQAPPNRIADKIMNSAKPNFTENILLSIFILLELTQLKLSMMNSQDILYIRKLPHEQFFA
jgi:hypothetical protein